MASANQLTSMGFLRRRDGRQPRLRPLLFLLLRLRLLLDRGLSRSCASVAKLVGFGCPLLYYTQLIPAYHYGIPSRFCSISCRLSCGCRMQAIRQFHSEIVLNMRFHWQNEYKYWRGDVRMLLFVCSPWTCANKGVDVPQLCRG
jgi:hypothetical protein